MKKIYFDNKKQKIYREGTDVCTFFYALAASSSFFLKAYNIISEPTFFILKSIIEAGLLFHFVCISNILWIFKILSFEK